MQARPTDPPTEAADLIIFTEEDMGESDLQFRVCEGLFGLLTDLLAAWNIKAKVGGNLQFRYRPDDPKAQVTPDVYVLPEVSAEVADLSSWATWEHGGRAPSLAIEVVSQTSKKDYALDARGMLARYQELGVTEVVRYDPHLRASTRTRRRLLTHWVRSAAGVLEEQPLLQMNLLRLTTIGVMLMHVGPSQGWLRLAQSSAEGVVLWPTRLERIQLERQRAEAEAAHAAAEAARAETEAARAETEAARAERAEAQIQALQAELARLRAGA